MSVFAVLVALEVAAVVLAARGARLTSEKPVNFSSAGYLFRRFAPSPLVLVLAYALADELAVEALHRFLFYGEHPVRAAIERHGWPARLAYHAETCLVVGWTALLSWGAWRVFAAPKK